MARRRRRRKAKTYDEKCPEPINTMIDLAGAAVMFAISEKMEKKHHYKVHRVPNPYRATAYGIASGRTKNSRDIARLGVYLGVAGAFDDD